MSTYHPQEGGGFRVVDLWHVFLRKKCIRVHEISSQATFFLVFHGCVFVFLVSTVHSKPR